MNNTEILYDHYKDTIEETKKQESRRNKLFIIILIHTYHNSYLNNVNTKIKSHFPFFHQ